MTFQLHHGDCLHVLRGMEDNSVDSIVTDPPYGLSDGGTKGVSERLADALFEVVLPDLYDANVKFGRVSEFSGPRDSVSFLDFMLRAGRVEPGVAVPESPVDFQRYVADQEIKNTSEGAGLGSNDVLAGVRVSQAGQFSGHFILQPRYSGDGAICNGASRLFREQGPGRIGVPVVIPRNSGFARFLGALAPCGPSFLCDVVRFCNDAGTGASAPAGVVAHAGAEMSAMLCFDARHGFLEILPANTALQSDVVFEVCPAQPVRAGSGAGGLPAKFESRTVGVVGDAANGAATFHFHKSLLELMNFSRKGFMGKEWDGNVPSVEVWAECLRVLKPGGHLLAFAGTRTQHRMAVRIEDAGFEIRDMIAWVYGSGFPKSHNGEWGGTALKPALEPITMARKPLAGTVAANVLQYGTGALNIDGCRVPHCGETLNGGRISTKSEGWDRPWKHDAEAVAAALARGEESVALAESLGRWPANLCHDGSEEVLAAFPDAPGQMADASTNSEQRKTQNTYGVMRRGRGDEASAESDNEGSVGFKMKPGMRRLDAGSAARFFYCAKASRADRNEGCEDLDQRPGGMVSNTSGQHITRRDGGYEPKPQGNHHPTVKPTDLMAYLCRLVTPPNGVVLDPFMGSGSTGKACMREGFQFIGIERESDFLNIARARIEHVLRQPVQHSFDLEPACE